jgi:hypothetical protein
MPDVCRPEVVPQSLHISISSASMSGRRTERLDAIMVETAV